MPPTSAPPPTSLRPRARGSRLDRLKNFFKTKKGIVTAAILFILVGSGAAYLTAPDDLGTSLNTENSAPAKDDPSLIDEDVSEGEAASEDEEETEAPPPPPASTQPPPPPPASPATLSVAIGDTGFAPNPLVIKKGTTVTWTNTDDEGHTVSSDSGIGPSSATLAPGQTYSFTFNVAGKVDYYCSLHPNMTGTITVTD